MDEKMIHKYIFYNSYDWDNCGTEEELDIAGDDYKKLITRLFKYSSCFSLRFAAPEFTVTNPFPWEKTAPKSSFFDKTFNYDNRGDFPDYDKYIIKKIIEKPPQNVFGTCFGHEQRFYRCCDETLEFLLTKFHSIFSFVPYFKGHPNPEDPYFYRSDGSVLFASITHEGECYMFPRDSEDFSDILTTPPWCTTNITKEKYYKWYCKFAHENMNIEEFNV